MKILILNHNQENYGTYHRCFFLAKFMAQQGIHIHMICASGRNFDFLIRHRFINNHFSLTTLPRFKYGRFFTGQLWRMFLSVFQVLFYKYDILHAFTVAQPQIGIPAWFAKKVRGKKLVVDWDDLWGGGFADEHPFPVRNVLTWFEANIPRYADKITYVSEFISTRLQQLEYPINKCVKIPNANGMDININAFIKNNNFLSGRKKLGLTEQASLIVSVGNTYVYETQELMCRTIDWLHKKSSDIKLVLVGRVQIDPTLRKKYRSLFREKTIILAGIMDFNKIADFCKPADLLLLPMSNTNLEKARFPMRLGDYLRANRVIVSNAVGEVLYILKKYKSGVCADPVDPVDLGRKILQTFNSPEKSDRYKLGATKAWREEFNWPYITSKLITVYNTLLGNDNGSKK